MGTRLAPVAPEHGRAVQRLVEAGPDVAEQTRLPDPYPPGGAEARIAAVVPRHARGEEYAFAVLDDADAVVGACGLVVDGREAELGYWIGRGHRGRGHATAAARAALRFAFEDAGLERVVALPLADNASSRRVLERAGLALVGDRPAEARWAGRRQAVYQTVHPAR